MSIGNAVFLRKTKMPTPAAWAAEIRRTGFDLSLPIDFDVETHGGFLPCSYRGASAGFEYSYELVADAELDDAVRARAEECGDVMVELVTHGDESGLACAVIASAVLATMSGGVHWSDVADVFQQGTECISWARELDAETHARLGEPRPRPVTPSAPRQLEVQLPGRVAFRGANLLMLETAELPPRRFTVRLPTADLPSRTDLVVTMLWEHDATAPTVRSFMLGGVVRQFDERGVALGGSAEIAHLVAALGSSDAAIRGLLAAGEVAAPSLVALALDPRATFERRRVALVILGQLGSNGREVLPHLGALVADASLGPAARRAMELIALAVKKATAR